MSRSTLDDLADWSIPSSSSNSLDDLGAWSLSVTEESGESEGLGLLRAEDIKIPRTALEEAGAGLTRGTIQTGGLGVAALALAAKAVGADDFAQSRMEDASGMFEYAAKNYAATIQDPFEDINSFGDAGMYATGVVFEMLPMTIASLGGAGIGQAAAAILSRRIVGNMVKEQIAKGVAREAAEAAVKAQLDDVVAQGGKKLVGERLTKLLTGTDIEKGAAGAFRGAMGTAGQVAGMAGSTYPLVAGEIGQSIYDNTGEIEPGVSFGMAVPGTALETLGDAMTMLPVLKTMKGSDDAVKLFSRAFTTDKGIATTVTSFPIIPELGKAVVRGALTEGPTEYAQTFNEQLAVNIAAPGTIDLNSEEAKKERLLAGVAGATAGAFLGGGGSVISGAINQLRDNNAPAVAAALEQQLAQENLKRNAAESATDDTTAEDLLDKIEEEEGGGDTAPATPTQDFTTVSDDDLRGMETALQAKLLSAEAEEIQGVTQELIAVRKELRTRVYNPPTITENQAPPELSPETRGAIQSGVASLDPDMRELWAEALQRKLEKKGALTWRDIPDDLSQQVDTIEFGGLKEGININPQQTIELIRGAQNQPKPATPTTLEETTPPITEAAAPVEKPASAEVPPVSGESSPDPAQTLEPGTVVRTPNGLGEVIAVNQDGSVEVLHYGETKVVNVSSAEPTGTVFDDSAAPQDTPQDTPQGLTDEERAELGLAPREETADEPEGTPLKLDVIVERIKAGETVEFSAADEDVTPQRVMDLLDFQATPNGGIIRAVNVNGMWVTSANQLDIALLRKAREVEQATDPKTAEYNLTQLRNAAVRSLNDEIRYEFVRDTGALPTPEQLLEERQKRGLTPKEIRVKFAKEEGREPTDAEMDRLQELWGVKVSNVEEVRLPENKEQYMAKILELPPVDREKEIMEQVIESFDRFWNVPNPKLNGRSPRDAIEGLSAWDPIRVETAKDEIRAAFTKNYLWQLRNNPEKAPDPDNMGWVERLPVSEEAAEESSYTGFEDLDAPDTDFVQLSRTEIIGSRTVDYISAAAKRIEAGGKTDVRGISEDFASTAEDDGEGSADLDLAAGDPDGIADTEDAAVTGGREASARDKFASDPEEIIGFLEDLLQSRQFPTARRSAIQEELALIDIRLEKGDDIYDDLADLYKRITSIRSAPAEMGTALPSGRGDRGTSESLPAVPSQQLLRSSGAQTEQPGVSSDAGQSQPTTRRQPSTADSAGTGQRVPDSGAPTAPTVSGQTQSGGDQTGQRGDNAAQSGPRPGDAGTTGGSSDVGNTVSRGPRPSLEVVGREILPEATGYVGPRQFASGPAGIILGEDQVYGINSILTRFLGKGDRAYMLADGVGLGKTLQILATARRLADEKNRPVLIVTQKSIVDNFKEDAAKAGIPLDNIEIVTYDAVRNGHGASVNYALVAFDEAHNLKNADAAKSIASARLQSDHVLFATATPLDKPTAASYFLAEILGRDEADVLDSIGVELVTTTKANGDDIVTPTLKQGFSWDRVKELILELRNEALQLGSMVRRYFPFYGELNESVLTLNDSQLDEQERIVDYWAEVEKEKGAFYARRLAIGDLGRWAELQKVDHLYQRIKEELAAGRAPIVMAETAGDAITVKALDRSHKGVLAQLEDRLNADGIKFAKIFGSKGNKHKEGVKFQNGEVQAVLATPQSGGTGLNLDDVTGNRPRTMLVASINYSGDNFDQMLGRVSRRTTKSPSRVEFINFDNSLGDAKRKEIISKKLGMLRAIQGGEDADSAMFEAPEEAPQRGTRYARSMKPNQVVSLTDDNKAQLQFFNELATIAGFEKLADVPVETVMQWAKEWRDNNPRAKEFKARPRTGSFTPADVQNDLRVLQNLHFLGGMGFADMAFDGGGVNTRKALQLIAKSNAAPRHFRMLARFLSQVVGKDSDLRFVNKPREDWAGLYTLSSGDLQINLAASNEDTAELVGVILHEVLHRVALPLIRNPRTAAQRAAVLKFRAVYEEAVGRLQQMRRSAGNRPEVYRRGEVESIGSRLHKLYPHLYGLNDPEEFLSEIFTNPAFQSELATLAPIEGLDTRPKGFFRNLLDQIVSYLTEMITGLPVRRDSLLSQGIAQAMALIQEDSYLTHGSVAVQKINYFGEAESPRMYAMMPRVSTDIPTPTPQQRSTATLLVKSLAPKFGVKLTWEDEPLKPGMMGVDTFGGPQGAVIINLPQLAHQLTFLPDKESQRAYVEQLLVHESAHLADLKRISDRIEQQTGTKPTNDEIGHAFLQEGAEMLEQLRATPEGRALIDKVNQATQYGYKGVKLAAEIRRSLAEEILSGETTEGLLEYVFSSPALIRWVRSIIDRVKALFRNGAVSQRINDAVLRAEEYLQQVMESAIAPVDGTFSSPEGALLSPDQLGERIDVEVKAAQRKRGLSVPDAAVRVGKTTGRRVIIAASLQSPRVGGNRAGTPALRTGGVGVFLYATRGTGSVATAQEIARFNELTADLRSTAIQREQAVGQKYNNWRLKVVTSLDNVVGFVDRQSPNLQVAQEIKEELLEYDDKPPGAEAEINKTDFANPREVKSLRDSLLALADNAEGLTQADLDAWKQANPEAYAELEGMREEVLKRAGYDIGPVWHWTPEDFQEFDLSKSPEGFHFGSENAARGRKETTARTLPVTDTEGNTRDVPVTGRFIRAFLRGRQREISDMDINTAGMTALQLWQKKLITAEGVDLVKAAERKAAATDPTSNYFRESEREKDRQEALEKETLLGRELLPPMAELQNLLGSEWTVFRYNNLYEDKGSTSFAVTHSEQIKSADPLNLEDGKLITPDQWAQEDNPNIMYARATRRATDKRETAWEHMGKFLRHEFKAQYKFEEGQFRIIQQGGRTEQSLALKAVMINQRYTSALKQEFKGPIPTATINLALGDTENRLTEDQHAQVEDARKKAKALRPKRGEAPDVFGTRKQQAIEAVDLMEAKLVADNRAAFLQAQQAAFESLPPKTKKAIKEMRGYIDDISNALMFGGGIDGDLVPLVEANRGLYLHRAYRAFEEADYAQRFRHDDSPEALIIKKNALALAYKYAVAQRAAYLRRAAKDAGTSLTKNEALDAAKLDPATKDLSLNIFDDWLRVNEADVGSVLNIKPGQKNLSILKYRKEIPPALRALWGQYNDPTTNFLLTTAKMASLLARHEMLSQMVYLGTRDGWLHKDEAGVPRPQGFVPVVADDNVESFRPLAGYYGSIELAEAFREYATSSTHNNEFMQSLALLTSVSMASKTVGSIQSVFRNFYSNVLPLIMSGNLSPFAPGRAARALKGAYSVTLGRKLTKPEERKALDDLYASGVHYGVALDGAKAQSMKQFVEMAKGERGEGAVWKRTLLKPAEWAVGLYQGVDDFWKFVMWLEEIEKLTPALPREGRDDFAQAEYVKQVAADRVRATLWTYSNAPKIIQRLKRGPGIFIAPFITFTSEVVRTTFNNVNIAISDISSDTPAMRKIGWQRMLGFMTGMAIPAAMAIVISRIAGSDDEDDDMIRFGLPDWMKDAQLAVTNKSGDGKVTVADLSFFDPYQYLKEPFIAFNRAIREQRMSGGEVDGVEVAKAFGAALQRSIDPFISEQIFSGAVMDVVRNQTAAGPPVYNPQAPLDDRLADMTAHIVNAFTPGTLNSIMRNYKAMTGYVEPSGRTYDPVVEALAPFVGVRPTTVDFQTVLRFAGSRYMRDNRDASSLLTQMASSRGTVNPEDLPIAYEKANKARESIFTNLLLTYRAALHLGVPEAKAKEILRASKVPQKTVEALSSGVYSPYEISSAQRKFLAENYPERMEALEGL